MAIRRLSLRLVSLNLGILLLLGSSATTRLLLERQAGAGFLTAVSPPLVVPPVDLQMAGQVVGGKVVDTLSWKPAPGAVSYNIYMYGHKVASGLTSLSYTFPPNQPSLTYTVTSLDARGDESIPSAPINERYICSQPALSCWDGNTAPAAPINLSGHPEWNLGSPRNLVAWAGTAPAGDSYNVYRDGQQVAAGLWGLYYIDQDVEPGSVHTYSVTSIRSASIGHLESGRSAPISVTALSTQPAQVASKVAIDHVMPESNSAKVFFHPVPGAADYRIYDLAHPDTVKYLHGWFDRGVYSQGQLGYTIPDPNPLGIEMNDIPPEGADLVVEAVDKPGPFQAMDGTAGPGMETASHQPVVVSVNGQGDPSDVPNVISSSDPFHVAPAGQSLAGGQAFFDNFSEEQPLVTDSSTAISPSIIQANAGSTQQSRFFYITQQHNDKWTIRQYGTDCLMSSVFFMGRHMMDTQYDGPCWDAGFSKNNNASDVFIPRASADISNGKVLHVTMEVDAHNDSRRWEDVQVFGADQPILRPVPQKLDCDNSGQNCARPAPDGNMFAWEVGAGSHSVSLFTADPAQPTKSQRTDLNQFSSWNDQDSVDRGPWPMVWNNGRRPYMNGTANQLDNRSRFDLYLSKSHYKIVETLPDGSTQMTREKDFPTGSSLPWDRVQVAFVHEVYHTANDRGELVSYSTGSEQYWYNYRPWADERHWDNMGFEVLDSVPASTPSLASQPPHYVGTAPTAQPGTTATPGTVVASAKPTTTSATPKPSRPTTTPAPTTPTSTPKPSPATFTILPPAKDAQTVGQFTAPAPGGPPRQGTISLGDFSYNKQLPGVLSATVRLSSTAPVKSITARILRSPNLHLAGADTTNSVFPTDNGPFQDDGTAVTFSRSSDTPFQGTEALVARLTFTVDEKGNGKATLAIDPSSQVILADANQPESLVTGNVSVDLTPAPAPSPSPQIDPATATKSPVVSVTSLDEGGMSADMLHSQPVGLSRWEASGLAGSFVLGLILFLAGLVSLLGQRRVRIGPDF